MWYWDLGNKYYEFKKLMGLPPKLELLAVFSSSDNVIGRSHTAVNRNAGVWTGQYVTSVTELHSIAPTMHRLHGCTCRLLVAYTVRYASTGTSMGCVYYLWTACSNTSHASTSKGLQYQFQSRSVSCSKLQIHTSIATSTFSKLPCFSRWLACVHNQCQTLVSVLARKRTSISS